MSSAPHDSRVPSYETQKYNGWKAGVNNILADHELPADMLRKGENVDVLDSGKLRRRKGITQLSSTPCHSLWSSGSTALCFASGALNRVNPNNALTALVTGLADRPISYTEAGLDIYWSNGLQYGRLSNGLALPWGVEVPALPPSAVSATGTLPLGTYQAAVTFNTASGEESAPSAYVAVSVTAGGLTFTIPQPLDAATTNVNLYLTQANEALLYHVAQFALGVTTFTISTRVIYGQQLRTEFLSRFIPCDIIATYHGCIYGAQGNTLWVTEPYAFGLYRSSQSYYQFRSPIRLVIPMTGGLYVVCDKTYWLEGTGPGDFKERELLPYGGARRSSTRLPHSEDAMWFSDRGLVIGDANGTIKPVQSENVLPGAFLDGATLIREQNSIKQAIAVVRNPTDPATLPAVAPAPVRAQDVTSSQLSASDFMTVEIVPHP